MAKEKEKQRETEQFINEQPNSYSTAFPSKVIDSGVNSALDDTMQLSPDQDHKAR